MSQPLNIPLIEAALEKSTAQLGTKTDFRLILARAQQIAPGAFDGLIDSKPSRLVTYATAGTVSAAASTFEGKAAALVAAGDAATLDDAFGMVAMTTPEAYMDYLKTLS